MIVTTVELINKGTQANGTIAYKVKVTFVGGEIQYLPTRHLPADINEALYKVAVKARFRALADEGIREHLRQNGLGSTVTPVDTPVAQWRQELLEEMLGNDSVLELFSYIRHLSYLDALPDNYLRVTMGLDVDQIVEYRAWVSSIQILDGIEDDFVVIVD